MPNTTLYSTCAAPAIMKLPDEVIFSAARSYNTSAWVYMYLKIPVYGGINEFIFFQKDGVDVALPAYAPGDYPFILSPVFTGPRK